MLIAKNTHIHPVIIAGGSGTRLWPKSTALKPKQFLQLYGDFTLFQHTVDRFRDPAFDTLTVVCNEEHRFVVAEQLQQMGDIDSTIILEPVGRNTAPAVALAALDNYSRDPESVMVVLPADHYISDVILLKQSITNAVEASELDKLVCLGIEVDRPETGYGYIKRSTMTDSSSVVEFVEKPNERKAQEYMQDNHYVWNAGIFVFKAKAYLDELRTYCPDMYKLCLDAYEDRVIEKDFIRVNKESFSKCESISVDYAVMEKTKSAWVVKMKGDWSDLGSWSSIWDLQEKDARGNVSSPNTILEDCTNCFVESEGKVLVGIGLEDLVIVRTEDATLVSKKEESSQLSRILKSLKQSNVVEEIDRNIVSRPWGSFENLSRGDNFKVKLISVNPGGKLSLQFHNRRSEYWFVVEGVADIVRGDDSHQLKLNESVFIPQKMLHRIENKQSNMLKIVEIQLGDYLEEDDIVRVQDQYGRVSD